MNKIEKKKLKRPKKEKGLKNILKAKKGKGDNGNINLELTENNKNKKVKKHKHNSVNTYQLNNLNLNLNLKNKNKNNNKPNPPKNSMTSDRELIPPEIKLNDGIKLISSQNNEKISENNKKEEKEKEEEEDKSEEEKSEEEKNDEEKSDEEESEENESEEKDEKREKEEKKDNINEEINSNKKKSENRNQKQKEKEEKIKIINSNSNEYNSTVSNIINNSKNLNVEKISGKKQLSNNESFKTNKKCEIKFGSVEFYKMLNLLPEQNRNQFFCNSEINYLDYEYACDIDKRSFCQIYSSMLKEENNIIYSFSFCADDYNLAIVKFSFLIIQLILYLTVISLFFADNTINNIFDKKNKFDIIYMLKPMAFTFAICFVINILLKALIKSNNNVIDIKYENKTFTEGLKAIRLKYIFYFIIGFLIMIFGWILICCFSAIFINSKIKLLQCAGYTLAANFILQIIFCFIISSFRKCSLKSEKKQKKCLYNFSIGLTYL